MPCFRGLRSKAIDEILMVCDFPSTVIDFLLPPCSFGDFSAREMRIVTVVQLDGVVIDVEDLSRDVVQKAMVV